MSERRESCSTCYFNDGGICHRYPTEVQRVDYVQDGYSEIGYDHIYRECKYIQWCGEWKADDDDE